TQHPTLRLKKALEKALHPPAIDCNGCPIDRTGAFGGKEGNQRGKFFRSREPSNRNLRRPRLKNIGPRHSGVARLAFGEFVESFGERVAGANVVDRNSIASEFIRKCFRDTRDSGAQRVRKQQAVDWLFDGNRGNRDEASPAIPLHSRKHLACEINAAQQCQIERRTPILQRDVQESLGRWPTCVGDANIHAAEFLLNGVHETPNRPHVGYVHRLAQNRAAVRFLDLARRLLHVRGGTRANRNFTAFFRKLLRRRPAQAFACRSDNCYLPFESEVHGQPLFAPPRRYASSFAIQSSRRGAKKSMSSVSSRASAACGTFAGINSTSTARTIVSPSSHKNFSAPERIIVYCSLRCECRGTIAPREISPRPIVASSPLIIWRVISGFNCSFSIFPHGVDSSIRHLLCKLVRRNRPSKPPNRQSSFTIRKILTPVRQLALRCARDASRLARGDRPFSTT